MTARLFSFWTFVRGDAPLVHELFPAEVTTRRANDLVVSSEHRVLKRFAALRTELPSILSALANPYMGCVPPFGLWTREPLATFRASSMALQMRDDGCL